MTKNETTRVQIVLTPEDKKKLGELAVAMNKGISAAVREMLLRFHGAQFGVPSLPASEAQEARATIATLEAEIERLNQYINYNC